MPARVAMEPDARRQQLIETATALFLQRGYAATSVSDIVRAASVAQGTFYYHFRSKDEMASAVAEQLVRPLVEAIGTASGDQRRGPRERALALLDSVLRTLDQHQPQLARLVLPGNEILHARLAESAHRQLLPALGQLLNEAVREDSLTVNNADATAEMLLVTVPHVARAHAGGEPPNRLAALRTAMREIFTRALGLNEHRS